MQTVGHVQSLWRYPVKSMRGEQLPRVFAGFPGIYGDRMYAFHDDGAPAGFPFLTAREQGAMLLFRASFRDPRRSKSPENLAAAEAMSFDLSSVWADPRELMVDVETSDGARFAIDDPALLERLGDGLGERHRLRLLRSQRALVDCRPVSIFAQQTAQRLGQDLGEPVDQRRFRANIYLDLDESLDPDGSASGFAEDTFVGRRLRLGERVEVAVLERDARCKMITLDPDTAEPNPELMKQVARAHQGKAGVYAAVLVEGTIADGDPVHLLD